MLYGAQMETWHDRAKLRISQLGLTRTEVAKRLGVSQQTFSSALNLKSKNPSSFSLDALAEVLSVTPLWLKEGITGSEVLEHPLPAQAALIGVDLLSSATDFAEGVLANDSRPDALRWHIPRDFMPYLLGEPRIIRVNGDSMRPDFRPGDMVMIDTGYTKPSPPGNYAIFDGIGVMFKRLEVCYERRVVRVISYNQERYPPIEFSYDHLRDKPDALCIVGRAVWNMRQPC